MWLRVDALELWRGEMDHWRDRQALWDTATVTEFRERFGKLDTATRDIRTSIGDLDGRSVASRLISMSVDVGNISSRQDVIDGRLGSLESDVGTLESDVAQILQILRNPNGDK
jgi:hypothetical protein